ncbi:MAG: DUF5686 family protein [Candidatus Kapaibacteriota bacterium]
MKSRFLHFQLRPTKAFVNKPSAYTVLPKPIWYVITVVFLLAGTSNAVSAQTLLPIEGVVVSKQTGEAIVAASVRVQGTNKGTYTAKDGTFRLPLPPGKYTLLVRSIGYESAEITVENAASATAENARSPLLRIELATASVRLGAVNVVAEVSPLEIIRRAIANKDANRKKIRSWNGLVYTKMTTDLSVPTLFLSAEQKQQVEQLKTMQMETFSRVMKQFSPQPYTKRTIVQRRQTANVPAQANLVVLDEFYDFTDSEVNLSGTRLRSPLGANGPDTYAYTIVGKKEFDSRLIYTIAFEPKSALIPGFQGTLQIIEGSYNIVEITAKPTEKTAIPLVNELAFYQKFERFASKSENGDDVEVWMPTLLELSGGVEVSLIKWIADIGIKLKIRSIVTELDINRALPSSVLPSDSAKKAMAEKKAAAQKSAARQSAVAFNFGSNGSNAQVRRKSARVEATPSAESSTNTARVQFGNSTTDTLSGAKPVAGEIAVSESDDSKLSVMSDADSAKADFWRTNALAKLSVEEEETYRRVDSVVKTIPPDTTSRTRREPQVNPLALAEYRLSSSAIVNVNPVIDYTRVSDYLLGATAQVQWDPSDSFGALIVASAAVNPSNRVSVGNAGVMLDVWRADDFTLSLGADVHSRLGALQRRTSLGERLSVLNLSNLLYQNAIDFYRQDGFSAGVLATGGAFGASLEIQSYRISNAATIVENARGNLSAQPGDYNAVQAEVSWNMASDKDLFQFASFTNAPETTLGARLIGRVGRERESGGEFSSLEARAQFLQPTFFTGYMPMYLRLAVNAGFSTGTTNGGSGLFAVPVQEQFIAVRRFSFGGRPTDFATLPLNGIAGTEYLSFHLEHNFSDILWRWIGIPTWKGRGLEFILLASAGRYNQRGAPINPIVSPNNEQAFAPTSAWHSELGVGISRIPSFISDLIVFRVDLLWGIGGNTLPGNNFGYSVSFSTPF